MGLKASGENGAKAQFKMHCARAFRTYDTLLEARKTIGATRPQTAVLVDMNVVLMSVPNSVLTLSAFVNIVWGFVEWALGTGWLTVLVFDEPKNMTNAKRLEQARRDAARNAYAIPCSDDVDPFPYTDNYTRENLDATENVLSVRNKRSSRSRMYDEVSRRIFEMASEKAAKWNASGKEDNKTVVVLDGVDIRGCDRPAFEPRTVGMVSNNEAICESLRRQVPIGEGDLKLQALEDRIRMLAMPGQVLAGTSLVMTSTIDTDSLMISALAVSKRRANPFGASVLSVLCMRNPASKSEKQDDPRASASYLVVDTSMLEACILEYIYHGEIVSPAQALNTTIALASCAALSGCDFCSLSGARFDHFFSCLQDFTRTEPLALKNFENCLSPDASIAKKACHGLMRVCYAASAKMEGKGKRYARQAQSVAEADDATLRRAIWTACYWSGNEFTADESFGFPTQSSSDEDDNGRGIRIPSSSANVTYQTGASVMEE